MKKEVVVHVYHEESYWKIVSQPVRDSLLAELKDSNPDKKIEIENCSNGKRKTVSLKEVLLENE